MASQPDNGKMEARLAFKAAVPEKVVINGSVGAGEAQTRGKCVLELLADEFGVGLFGFHEAQRGEAKSSQPTAHSERHPDKVGASAEHRGRSTKNTEKEVD